MALSSNELPIFKGIHAETGGILLQDVVKGTEVYAWLRPPFQSLPTSTGYDSMKFYISTKPVPYACEGKLESDTKEICF